MDKAFNYRAKNRSRDMIDGVVYAADADSAYLKLTQMGYVPADMPTLNPHYTVRNLITRGFDRKELARFYSSMSKRLKNGRSVPEGLDNAIEFVDDPRLKQSLAMMRQFVQEGNSLAAAMKLSGFPLRDVEIVRSTAEAGKTAESLMRISQEIFRAETLRKSIMSVIRMPIIVLFIMYCAIWGVTVFIAPVMMKFFKSALGNVKLPAFAKAYYDFAAVFKANLTLSTIIYVSILVAVVWFVRSPTFRMLLEKIPLIRVISERSDMANLWTSFAMLYDAGINTEETTKLLAAAAARPESKDAFMNMHRLLRSGSSIEVAVQRSQFPVYVIRGIQASVSSGDLVGGLEDMCRDLATDVEEYTSKLKDNIQLFATLVLSIFVLMFFMVTYYPIISATLSQV